MEEIMKYIKRKYLLFIIVYSLLQFEFVECVCVVNYPEDIETLPIYWKTLGKYNLFFPINAKQLKLQNGEIIQALCRTNFASVSYTPQQLYNYGFYDEEKEVFENQTLISLQCRDSKLHINNYVLRETILKCNKLNWSVFDANEKFEWCEKNQNATTFMLAATSNEGYHVLAGICFNLKEYSLLTITYNITHSGQKYDMEMLRDITKTQLKSTKSLGPDLWDFKTDYFDLSEYDLKEQLKEMTETNAWLGLANYEISPIVQAVSYKKYFDEYVHILNIVWWQNLRLGNWKLFMNTLEKYTYNNSFQLYTGTSGVVKTPSMDAVHENVLEIKNGYVNKTVPGYIWTYLTSMDNLNEDFIIVGCNSPYTEWLSKSDVLFCPNICSQIPWLKEIYPSFQYATAGIMFCCSPDFLHQKNIYLDGFPIDILVERATRKKTHTNELTNLSDNDDEDDMYEIFHREQK